ncbi:hypothetical protein SprV_0100376400 [Sparganum proliferum]
MYAYRDERPGIRIAYRTDGHLKSQQMQASTRISTTTVHDPLFVDLCTYNAASDADMRQSMKLCLSVTLNIGLRRSFTWTFVIADIPHAILGLDFLAEFDILVDCRHACLPDCTTGLSVRGLTPFTALTNLSVLDTDIDSPFQQLLLRHPSIINPQFLSGEVQHDFVHHIRTSDPPVFARPRRLAPERFQAAKAEFEHLLQLGIIRPSKSPWASPLHMASTATSGDWRPCGDYRALNSATIPDRYPVSHLEDFAGALLGEAVFSKIDLMRVFHQIPVAAEDVTTPFGLFEFIRMPFGLCNVAQTFLRFIDHGLRGLPFVYAYTDDLLVVSRNEGEHKEHLALVFDRLDKFGVVINPSKLLPAGTRYNTFGRELLAIYLTVQHFRHFLEGRDITVFTDHKPLTFALRSHSNKYNPREIAHLDYITQFTTDIHHIDGTKNDVADMLSRPSLSSLQLSHGIDLCAMAAEQQRIGCPGDESVSGLQLKGVPLTTGSSTILCDVSAPIHRPFVPASTRRAVFQTLHGLSHPGIRDSQKLLAERFVWPGMNKDVKAWARSCLSCQLNKVQRHNKSAPGTFLSPDARFSHLHLDVVGPLPPTNGKTGAQFELALYQTLLNFLGCTRILTTACHPAANGMVKRFHRQLKTALRAVEDPKNWSDNIPLALLGIRAALKSDLGCSAAEFVFGATLELPREMVTLPPRGADETPDSLVHRSRQFMRSLSPVPPRTESYVEKHLDNCTHVFVWCERVSQPLESPYEGPFHVLARNAKTCRILCGDKEDVVSVDRVKVAVAEEPPDLSQGQKCANPLTPVPLSSLSPAHSPCTLSRPSPPLPSFPPSRLLPLPPCQQHPTVTLSSTTARSQPSSTVPPAYITLVTGPAAPLRQQP